jgi:putative peptidoglycan lipid II flippase
MRLALLMTIPASVGMIVLAEPIISVLYQHGRFGAYETAESAGALRCYAIGLCGYTMLKLLVNAFYALDQGKTPMIVSLLALALNLLLNWLFTIRLGWGHRGLALSTGCVATCNFLVLYWLMRVHLSRLETRRLLGMLGKLAVSSVALAAVCWASQHWLLSAWATQAFFSKLGGLTVAMGLGTLVFVVCGSALRIEELEGLIRALRRRLQRVP